MWRSLWEHVSASGARLHDGTDGCADVTVTIHFAFLLFVVLGGVMRRRYRWLTVPHLLSGCLGRLRRSDARPDLSPDATRELPCDSGRRGWIRGSFIEHYLVPIIYPDGTDAHAAGSSWLDS
jgi:hypothetical protein